MSMIGKEVVPTTGQRSRWDSVSQGATTCLWFQELLVGFLPEDCTFLSNETVDVDVFGRMDLLL